ncbi:hypothetical protein [Cellulomonas sp. NPDC089187]|uniref:hypothetical protein n=1 Tax=Cellulomonas sp. NPDC089187 TaxID=3154970 RepID=UPI003420D936
MSRSFESFIRWKSRNAATVVRVWLFFVSYAPLFLIIGLRAWPNRVAAAIWVGAWGLFTTLAWFALRRQRHLTDREVKIYDVQSQGSAVSSYLATYLLPFVSTTPAVWGDWVAYGVFFVVALVVYVRSDLALVNPTLYVLGYRVTEATMGANRVLVISRRALRSGESVRVTDFLDASVVRD